MSDMDGRTEPATSKKRSEERQKGHVCKTPELSSSLILLAGFIVLNNYGNNIMNNLKVYLVKIINFLPYKSFTYEYLNGVGKDAVFVFLKSVAPFLLTILIIGIVANIAQVKFVVSFSYLKEAGSKFNPAAGIKKMFSMNSFVVLFKDVIKASIILFLGYSLIKNNLMQIILFTGREPAAVMESLQKFIYQFGSRGALVMLLIAAVDYFYQKKQFEKGIMMTKQEVKDEMKSQEGDPLIKSRIKRKQLEMSMKRMMSDVPTADVVVTNPTAYAVALKYSNNQEAPVVVAKGIRLVAQRIKDIAIENDIPVVENVFVAQALYWQIKVGQQIPSFLYYAVAEILAYVYKLKNKYAMNH
jgi:flagellar biosynthetic protein FlhB